MNDAAEERRIAGQKVSLGKDNDAEKKLIYLLRSEMRRKSFALLNRVFPPKSSNCGLGSGESLEAPEVLQAKLQEECSRRTGNRPNSLSRANSSFEALENRPEFKPD